MQKILVILFLILVSCSKQQENEKISYTVIDDLNNKITFSRVPQKIISLAPSITEMIFTLNLGNKLIADTKFCNYPPEADKKIKVSDLITADYEKIVSLKPDIVFVSLEGNKKEMSDKLKSLGIKVFATNPRNYEGILKSMKEISEIFKINNVYDSIKTDWERATVEIKRKTEGKKLKRAYFFITLNPVLAAGKNTFLNDIMQKANIDNLAKDAIGNYPQINREEVILKNPDYILIADHSNSSLQDIYKLLPEWKKMEKEKIILLNPDLYNRPGARFLESVNHLVEMTNK